MKTNKLSYEQVQAIYNADYYAKHHREAPVATQKHVEIEILKGHTEKLIVSDWKDKAGRMRCSIGQQWLDNNVIPPVYRFKKGGMALSKDEANELAVALLKVIEIMPDEEIEEEED